MQPIASASVQPTPGRTNGASLPMDQCCLVVQMPSVDEMKREVADITCQMQSVYCGEEAPCIQQRPMETSLTDVGQELSSEDDEKKGLTFQSPTMQKFNTLGKLSPMTNTKTIPECESDWRSKSNTISKMIGNKTDVLDPTPKQTSISSSLPREEQVSEEFVINGRRYRQTYHRRVVLERRTTRDVFFLPATTNDSGIGQNAATTLEYTSPRFTTSEDDPSRTTAHPNGPDISCRPRLDLTVIHNRNGLQSDNTCITPTVVMRPTSAHHSAVPREHPLEQTTTEDKTPSVKQTSARMSDILLTYAPVSSNEYRRKEINPKRSKSKYLARELADTFRKRITSNLRRSKSMKPGICQSNTEPVASQHVNKPTYHSVKKTDSKITDSDQMDNGNCCKIVGYMYQFGVWDDRAPVLDPRLPIAMCDSVGLLETKRGTVIANPPEWHHAEVGLETPVNSQAPLVRGRIVACLQRFTQHSSASGKPLHRSTYVQQTRLVRQRKNQKTNSATKGVNADSQFPFTVRSDRHQGVPLDTGPELAHGPNGFKKATDDMLECVTEPGNQSTKFAYCVPDRLQLLQSICPSAAAATILLGRQLSNRKLTAADEESDSDELNEQKQYCLGETRVLVTATSWCPSALIAHDLSPYLVFNTTEGNSNCDVTMESDASKTNKNSGIPQLQLRGGTLDGLISYALQLLRNKTTASQLDDFFPHVLRVTYPTFTTPERIIEKLIQYYVAFAPVEPGCQASGWTESLTAAGYLVQIATELGPEQLSARLVLRLARFARLLILDGLKEQEINGDSDVSVHLTKKLSDKSPDRLSLNKTNVNEHKILADCLLENLPLLSASAKLRERVLGSTGKLADRPRRRSSHVLMELNRNQNSGHQTNTAVDPRRPDEVDFPPDDKRSQSRESSTPKLQRTVSDSHRKLRISSSVCVQSQLCLDAALERAKQFIKADPRSIAVEITRVEEDMFAQIEFHEFLDVRRLERGEAPTLSACVEHFNRLARWAKSLLFVLGPRLGEHEILENYPKTIWKPKNKGSMGELPVQQELGQRVMKLRQLNGLTDDTMKEPTQVERGKNAASKMLGCTGLEQLVNTKNSPRSSSTIHNQTLEPKVLRIKQRAFVNLILCQMCEILKHLKVMKNFSSLLALLLAVQEVPECILNKKSRSLLEMFSGYMKPPIFTGYRRDLEAAELPYLPYLGLIFQQLIHLHAGNSVYLSETADRPMIKNRVQNTQESPTGPPLGVMQQSQTSNGQIINVWRCWKHYLILGYFIKRNENLATSRHTLPRNSPIEEILNHFEDIFPDKLLDESKEQLTRLSTTNRAYRLMHTK